MAGVVGLPSRAMTTTEVLSGRVVHPAGDGIVYGPGTARAELTKLLGRVGAARPVLVTTASVVRAGLADEVAGWMGGDVPIFAGSKEHTPSPVVLEAAEMARAVGADSLVSLGGSSVVDLTKGIALVLAEGGDLDRLRLQAGGGGGQRPRLTEAKVPHIALPTTLSGAEFTGAAGITDPGSGEKRIYSDAKLAPRWVVLDPELARYTPPALWAATGMKVLSDTVEVFCSPRTNPLAEAVAGGALALLLESLVAGTADPDNFAARGRSLFAVGMALPQLATVGVGLVAALRHQLGGGAGVAHGVGSTIVLPHVLRWNRPVADAALAKAAHAGGLAGPDGLIARIEEMTVRLGLPPRLRDVGVDRSMFPAIAAHVLADPAIRTNARPVPDAAAVTEVLDAAW